jgi:hypothetical protein
VAPVAGSSRGISTTLARQARGSSKKKVVNPDAMELSEAARVLRVSLPFHTTFTTTHFVIQGEVIDI